MAKRWHAPDATVLRIALSTPLGPGFDTRVVCIHRGWLSGHLCRSAHYARTQPRSLHLVELFSRDAGEADSCDRPPTQVLVI